VIHYKWLISLLLMSGGVCAQQYNLSNNQYPPCNTWWQKSGNSYTCSGNGQVTLNDGDVIVADVDSTLIANDGFYLINNQVGNASNRISLQANYGAIASQGSQNTIYGDVSANSSNVTFNNTNLIGNVTTGGNVTINGGSVQGNLTSNDRTVVITGANVVGNITAQSGIVITGSVYSGNITMTSNNSVTFNSVDMTSGSVSGASHFTANNSQLGRPDSQVSISTTSNDITLNDSTAYGDFNAAINNAGGQVNVNNSSITGTCSPISNPLNACDPSPVARYHFDEVQWSGAFNEVKNAFGSSLNGRAMNGALTSSQSPALPANINNYGTCGYGEFVANQNQYVQVAHDSQLSFSDQLTISAWVYPVSRPANGGLHTIVAKDTNYEFHLDSQGRVFWYWERSSGGANTLTTSNVIPLNTWTHITIRYNRSASSNERQKIYINGVVAATNSDNQPLKTNTVNLEIGRDYNSDNRTFSGRLDEVAIYNKALTDSQIVNLYNERHLCQSSGLQCFSDDFQSQPLDEQWRVFSSSGNFTPSITNNRMRLTQALQNQATASTFQRIFPAAGNRVEVEFDYFAYGGNGADGVAIVFSDASVTPQVGAFGGPLGFGYKVNEQKPGFAGGWLGIGLDEYGNYSIEGGGNGPGRRRQAVVLRGSGSGYSGYNYLAGTCNNGTTNTNGDCLNPRVDNTNGNPQHRYRIVIDSTQALTSLVTVSRKVGTDSWKTLIGPVDVMSFAAQQNVPTDLFMSITGSTGSSTNNHEIDNFEVCALNSRPVGEQINHFRISLPAQGLTCAASDVSVTACSDENCNNLFTDPVIAYLVPNSLPSATGGWVNGSTISFSNGVGNTQLRRNSAGNVTVDVSGSVPTAMSFNNTLCSHNGNAGPFLASNCTMNFADSGFILDVPNSYANQSVTGTIKAVRKDNASQLCLPSFQNIQKPVSFWSDYLSPNGGQDFSALSVGVNSVTVGQSSNTATPVVLNFNQNGEASINVSYREAGSLALNARLTGSGDEQDLQLTGQTTFIRVPRALVLSATSYYGVSGACPNADISCDIFARADENFNLNIKAVAEAPIEDNDFTNNLGVTNYQQANIELKHTLIAPATGVPGALGEVEYDHQLGSSTTVQQRVSEVGVFDFSLNAPTTYLGLDLASENLPIAVTSTGPIGRFIPAYFSPSSVVTSLQAECEVTSPNDESFSYLGQPFGYKENPGIYLHPKSASGSETVNYFDSAWWRYDRQWDNRIYNDTVNSLPISFDSDLTSVNRVNGVDSRIELSGEILIYQKPPQPIVPFNSKLDLTLLVSDLTDLDGVCYRETASSPCIDYTITDIDDEMKLRWGKLVIHDTYGPETSALSQPITSEYFTANGFVTNSFDSCTRLPDLANFTLTPTDLTLGSGGAPEVYPTLVSQTLALGAANINFTAPGAGHQGFIDTLLDLNAHGLPWLRPYNDQNSAFENEVSGRVQFGLYRGSDRVIWWREKN